VVVVGAVGGVTGDIVGVAGAEVIESLPSLWLPLALAARRAARFFALLLIVAVVVVVFVAVMAGTGSSGRSSSGGRSK